MNSNNLVDFPNSDNDVELTHQRYIEGVKKALLVGIGTQPGTEDKYMQAIDEVLHNPQFWHDPEIYDAIHYAAHGQTFNAEKIRDNREKAPLPSIFQAALYALPLIEEEMTRYYGADIREIMGNYYLGTPLSPVDITQTEASEDDTEGEF